MNMSLKVPKYLHSSPWGYLGGEKGGRMCHTLRLTVYAGKDEVAWVQSFHFAIVVVLVCSFSGLLCTPQYTAEETSSSDVHKSTGKRFVAIPYTVHILEYLNTLFMYKFLHYSKSKWVLGK